MKSTCFVDNPNITASSRVSSALLAVSTDVHTKLNLICSCLESRIGVLLKFPNFYLEPPPPHHRFYDVIYKQPVRFLTNIWHMAQIQKY